MEKNILNIVENSKVMHPIIVAGVNGSSYWDDFLQVIEDYKKVLSAQEFNHFLDKSQLDCKIGLNQYLQFSSEVTVVDYIIRNYKEFKNEPKYNGNKNPECSFVYGGRTINIEVKCPDFTKRIKQENLDGVKLYAAERSSNKDDYDQLVEYLEANIEGDHHIQTIDRMDNKLKDYLISAHQKFPVSDVLNFNILVIALDIIPDMDEWYSYLVGENGVFTDRTYIKEDYSNVDAVLLTNVQDGHMGHDVYLNTNCWQLENYISLLILDPRKVGVNELGKYYADEAVSLFGGLTCSFLSFQYKLDQNNDIRNCQINEINLDENLKRYLFYPYYIKDKIIDFQIISKWTEILKR